MIEKFCPKCKIPMQSDKCVNPQCGHETVTSSTIYWCEDCNVPIFEKQCPKCGNKGNYIATDIRPVFPEEKLLLALLLERNPFYYQEKSVWYGSNAYIINGKKREFLFQN